MPRFGRIDDQDCIEREQDANTKIYVTGPPILYAYVVQALPKMGWIFAATAGQWTFISNTSGAMLRFVRISLGFMENAFPDPSSGADPAGCASASALLILTTNQAVNNS